MEIIRKVFGELLNNCYIIFDCGSGEAYVIDPGYEAKKLASIIRKRSFDLKGIILTHFHYDHSEACEELRTYTGAPVFIHKSDARMYKGHIDAEIEDGCTFQLGGETIETVHTPGHSRGSICLVARQSKNAFTGDTVFPTDTGYVIFDGGSAEDMQDSIQRLDRILTDDFMIWPGHEDNVSMSYVRKHNREYNDYVRGVGCLAVRLQEMSRKK